MVNIDLTLYPGIQELVDSYDVNCREIENRALYTLCSLELPVFSFLRDLNGQKCYYVLCRLRDWFGSTPTKEYCLCLMTVTDYISCSYNNTDFYGTFVKEKQDRFYESFFLKLSNEWKVLFHKMPFTVLSWDQFISLKNSLSTSIARFSRKFAYKSLLSDIMTSCDEYSSRLKKHLSDSKARENFKIGVDILNNTTPVLLVNSGTVDRIISASKSSSISVPYKVITKPKTPNVICNLVRNQLPKRMSLPSTQLIHEPKKIDFSVASSKEIKPLPVIVIGDSPVKMNKTSLKLDNITNIVSSKAVKRPVEPCEVQSLNVEEKIMKCQNEVVVSNTATKTFSQRKLNAFDILMRRKTIKTIS